MPRKVEWHDDWISNNYQSYESYEAMVTDYNIIFNDNVSKAGLKNHTLYKLGLKKPRNNCRHYTEEQIEWLKEMLPKHGRKETCAMFNETFNESRTERSMKSFGMWYGIKVEEDGWKSRVTENLLKDKIKPIGTERVDNGYPMVKVADGDWRQKNRLIYEDVFGKIPEGYAIVHLDNDPTNCDIDNMMAVPRSLLSALIATNMKSEIPQVTKTAILWLQLNELIRRGHGITL